MAGVIGVIKAVAAWYAGLNAYVQVVIRIVAAYAVSTAASRIAAKKFKGDGARFSKDASITDTVYPHSFIYGEAVVGGLIWYSNIRPGSGGNGSYLYMAIAHASHECEDVTGVYFDSDFLTTEIDWVSNEVTSGKYRPAGGPLGPSVKIYKKLGAPGQTAFTELESNFTDITSDHRAQGRCMVLYEFFYQKASRKLFEAGQPRSIRARVKGMKIYDPRLDSTNGGSGSHRLADETTWEWSVNPVLCACDYMRRYMNVADTRFDWPSISANADVCDVLVDIPGSLTQNRFACNGAGSLANSHGQNLDQILSSCLGFRVKVNGLWRIVAGGYQTPDVSIDEADIAGEVVMQSSFSSQDRYNKVGSVYISADHQHYENDASPLTNAAYLSRDNGREIRTDIKLPFVDDEYQAQRIQFYHLNQGNQQKLLTVPMRWTGLRIAPGAGVTLTYDKYNFSSKTFRCIEWQRTPGGGSPFVVVLREDSASAWADPEVGDYVTKNAQGVVVLGEPDPLPPENLTATASEYGGIQLDWDLPDPRPEFIRIYSSPDSAWANATILYEGLSTSFVDSVAADAVRYYWGVGVIDGGETEGTRNPDSDTSTITAVATVAATESLALIINRSAEDTANGGEAALVGVSNGLPDFTRDGTILWDGARYTLPRAQMNIGGIDFTMLTGVENDRGLICFDTTESNPFTVASNACDVALIKKTGSQWQYDNNGSWVNFSKVTGMVALGWLQTGAGDTINGGGLFGSAIDIDAIGTLASLDSVDTNEIDLSAVTEIYSASDPSENSNVLADNLLTIAIPAKAVGYTAVIVASANAWISNDTSGGAHNLVIGKANGGSSPTGTVTSSEINATASPGDNHSLVLELDVPASTAENFYLHYLGTSLGDAINARDLSLVVFLTKR